MRKILLVLAAVLVLGVLIPAVPAMALTSDDITVTATPAYITITLGATDTWTINGITGTSKISPDTMYYSNPLGDTTPPSTTVVDGECRFTLDSTGTTVNIDVTVNFPDHTGGDASTNSDLGTNDTTKFGAYSYWSGKTFASKTIAKKSGSDEAYTNLTGGNSIKFGLQYESQSNAWTSGTSMSSTVSVSAAAA